MEAATMMRAGLIQYVNKDDWSGHYNRDFDILEIGNEAFAVSSSVTYANMHQAMGGTIAHEIRHRRDPSTETKHTRGTGNTPHDEVYRFGFACAGFNYTS
jgi:hypothetical protein